MGGQASAGLALRRPTTRVCPTPPQPPTADTPTPCSTPPQKNELLHGRLAMLGFFAALVNEASTGLGPLGQVRALAPF